MAEHEFGAEFNEAERDQDVISENKEIAQPRAATAQDVEEIREYLRTRQAKRRVIKTTRTQQGQELDWVEPASQTPDGRIAARPPGDGESNLFGGGSPNDHTRWPQTPAQFELEVDPAPRGPRGTVPLVRRGPSRLRTTGNLQDFLSKHGRRTHLMRLNDKVEVPVPADNSTHVYAYSQQSGTCYGGEGNINVWSPYIQWSDEMTLGQISMARGAGGGFQTVEAGWQKLPNLYGDWKAHLFVFYTTNGYGPSGDNLGGYNEDVDGWVQVSPTIFPEALVSARTYQGPQAYINVKFQLSQGNWWLRVKGQWIGYYPASLFQFFGLQSQAAGAAFFGEVADSSSHAGTTDTRHGKRALPVGRVSEGRLHESTRRADFTDGHHVEVQPADHLCDESVVLWDSAEFRQHRQLGAVTSIGEERVRARDASSLPPVKLDVLGKDETSSSTRSGGDRCSSRRAASTAA